MKMENKQEILEALEEFSKQPQGAPISNVLDQYLSKIAATGITLFPWSKLKPLILRKMNLVIGQFQKEYPVEIILTCPNVESVSLEEMKKRLYVNLDLFNGIPFTIQRICELLTDDNISKQYRRTDKFVRGIEKNLIVVTTVDPFGNRIVGEPKSSPNGALSDMSIEEDRLVTSLTSTPVSKTTSSWFSSLSSVVDSPDSYPNWKHSQEQQQKQDGVTSSSQEGKGMKGEEECLPPPSKLFRPSDDYRDEKTEVKDETASTQSSGFTLLTQLLNSSSTPLMILQKLEEPVTTESCDSTEVKEPNQKVILEFLNSDQTKNEAETTLTTTSEDLQSNGVAEATDRMELECSESGSELEDVEMKEADGENSNEMGNRDSETSNLHVIETAECTEEAGKASDYQVEIIEEQSKKDTNTPQSIESSNSNIENNPPPNGEVASVPTEKAATVTDQGPEASH